MQHTPTPADKPKVLIVNKFYYARGGDCVYTLGLERLLREHGHETAVFAMDFSQNIPSPWQKYFPAEISFSGGIGAKLKAVNRVLGKGDVKSAFSRVLADFQPDIVHLNNIHSYLSPVLAELARKAGAKVVWTLHDYKLICPSYSCLYQGRVCEDCFTAGPKPVLQKKCMKGSLAASAIAWLEAKKWNRERLAKSVDSFVCPSQFMASCMAKGGFDSAKLQVLNNFVNIQTDPALPLPERGDYCCYVGRLSGEKGVGTLLEAAAGQQMELRVAGGGPLLEELKEKYASCPQIKFLGMLNRDDVASLLRHAGFSIIPSEWYENNPLSVIESLCQGTPVLGARIGGIPELVTAGNGLLFNSADSADLREKMGEMQRRAWDYAAIQKAALDRFDPEVHYSRILELYRR